VNRHRGHLPLSRLRETTARRTCNGVRMSLGGNAPAESMEFSLIIGTFPLLALTLIGG